MEEAQKVLPFYKDFLSNHRAFRSKMERFPICLDDLHIVMEPVSKRRLEFRFALGDVTSCRDNLILVMSGTEVSEHIEPRTPELREAYLFLIGMMNGAGDSYFSASLPEDVRRKVVYPLMETAKSKKSSKNPVAV